jgi:hypothetical protein
MPPHPETLPQADRELYEAMVEKHLRQVEPALEERAAELKELTMCVLRFKSSLGRVARYSRRSQKKAMG